MSLSARIERMGEDFFVADHLPITAADLAVALEAHAAEYDAAVAAGEDPWKACVRLHQRYWLAECEAQAEACIESEEFNRRAAA